MRIITRKIYLKGFGDFYANVYKRTEKGTFFIFDECVALRPMNETGTNEGGFETSDLKKWIDTELIRAFPDNLRNRIIDLSIPSVGEFFGHEDEYINDSFECDDDEQLSAMQEETYKMSWYQGNPVPTWLKNPMKKELSKSFFATVSAGGDIDYRNAAAYLGVRPVFWLKNSNATRKVEDKKKLRYEKISSKNTPYLADMLIKIEKQIKENRLTIKEVACKIGVTSDTVYKWLGGKTAITAKALFELADVAGYELTLVDKKNEKGE